LRCEKGLVVLLFVVLVLAVLVVLVLRVMMVVMVIIGGSADTGCCWHGPGRRVWY
jgi:hypothetical protein